MTEISQIKIGQHITGIIGLKEALSRAAQRCQGMDDTRIGDFLVEQLSKSNYIESRLKSEYAVAFLREYRKHIGAPVAAETGSGMMIKVLGRGCAQCDRLEQEVMAAMAETGIAADLEHVRNLAEIGRYGVLGMPALVINGEVKVVGSVPSRAKIKAWIEKAAEQAKS